MRGRRGIRFALLGGLACLAAACSPYLEREPPGVFFDVQLAESPPRNLCQEFAAALAAQLNFTMKSHGPLEQPDQCGALLSEAGDVPLREIWITADPARKLLFVELRERGPAGPEKPSRQTQELGKRLARLIAERFPGVRITRGKRFSGLLAR